MGVSLFYVAISRGVFLYGDDILMFQVTESIVERGTVAVTSPHDRGDVAVAVVGADGRSYAKYGIGQSLIAIPGYVASDVVLEPLLPIEQFTDSFGNQRMGAIVYGTALTNAVIGGATVALTFLLALACDFSRRTAFVVAAILAFGTLLAHYSATFLSEPLTGLALTGTVYGLVRAHAANTGGGVAQQHNAKKRVLRLVDTGFGWLTVSGFMAGLALASKPAAGMMLVAPGLWLLWLAWRWSRRDLLAGVLACLAWGVPIALWLGGISWYNWVRYRSLTETGYGGEARAFTTPLLTGLEGLLVSPGKGVVWYDPPLLLALVGMAWFARRRGDVALVVVGMLVGALLLYARYYAWYGGGVWGTRFLVPLLPLLMLPAGEIIERAWLGRRVAAVAIVVVIALGLFTTALGILVPFDRYISEYNASPEYHDAAIWAVKDSPLIIHAQRLDETWHDPDIAAVRYGSTRLSLISLAAAMLGIGLLTWTGYKAITASVGRSE